MKPKPTAIVTGASRGIGRAIAITLAEENYNLALTARSREDLEITAAQCLPHDAECLICPADITDEEAVKALFKKASGRFPSIDLLVNNAGMGIFKKIPEMSLDEWNSVMTTNVTSAFLCCREALKVMTIAQKGIIINISSVVGIKGYPNQGAYTASKHAMVGLTKVIAEEYREHGIRAHVICPGGVATDMVRQARPDLDTSQLIQPKDIGDLIKYLVNLPPQVMVDLVHIRRFGSQSF